MKGLDFMTNAFAFFIYLLNQTKETINWNDAVICTYSDSVSVTFLNGKDFTEEMYNALKVHFTFHCALDDPFDVKKFPDGSKFSFMIRTSEEEEEEEEE